MLRTPPLVLVDPATVRRTRLLRRTPSATVGIGLLVASAVPFALVLAR